MPHHPEGAEASGSFQDRVLAHLRHVCDGVGDPSDVAERRDRFGEESIELFQALGGTETAAHALVRYVFGRTAGEPGQEMGGTMTTLAALAAFADLDMVACGEVELARAWRPEVIAKIRRKRANRHGRGPLPGDGADLVTAAVPVSTEGADASDPVTTREFKRRAVEALPVPPAALASPALAVPEEVRRLSEAATQGEWFTESEKCDGSYGSGEEGHEGYLAYNLLTDAVKPYGSSGVILESSNSTIGEIHEEHDEYGTTAWDDVAKNNTAFIAAAVNFVRSLLDASPAAPTSSTTERVRHLKRGTEAVVLHRDVELQVAVERPFRHGYIGLYALEEGSRLVVYQEEDGKLWAREEGEFDDGRFEPIAAPSAPGGQSGDGWQPIETAPKGGGKFAGPAVLVWAEEYLEPELAQWEPGAYAKSPRPYWSLVGCRTMDSRSRQPTHWRPLPPPPDPAPAPDAKGEA